MLTDILEQVEKGLPKRTIRGGTLDLGAKKNSDLFRKYGVLNRSEYDSRIHIAIEKYVKQLGIEAETMVSMAKSQILPAALEHQRRVAEAAAATKAAGVDSSDSVQAL